MRTTTKKYLVAGGEVRSMRDGQLHYVDAHKLLELYGLDRRACVLVDKWNRNQLVGVDTSKLVALGPDPTGQYRIPS